MTTDQSVLSLFIIIRERSNYASNIGKQHITADSYDGFMAGPSRLTGSSLQ
jgi:hypothetical protein